MANWRLWRIVRARPYFFLGYALGAVLLLVPLQPAPLPVRLVAAWDIGSVIYLGLTAVSFVLTQERDISADAKSHREGQWIIFGFTITGGVMSFLSVFLFLHIPQHSTQSAFYLLFVIATLSLSWAITHVTFAYRYAHEYYAFNRGGDAVDGGIIFPEDDQPDYLDFLYFSFCLGMTFQVSDCEITAKKLRRLATLQGLISFLFNTVILAMTVNIAATSL